MDGLHSFHFIRPYFLLLLLPAIIIVVLLWRQQKRVGNWSQVIDEHLLSYLTQGSENQKASSKLQFRKRSLLVVLLVSWLVAIIALAGPAWRKLPQPLHQQHDVLVMVLDLSLSMFAQDSAPSRVVQARRKIEDVLKVRKEGLTALVVYSGGANVVSPLTDDVNTILALLPSLDPGIMPSYGSKLSEALAISNDLLVNSGANSGQLLLLSDAVSEKEIALAQSQVNNFDIGVIGVGEERLINVLLPDGNVLLDRKGQQVTVKRETAQLKKLASSLNGRYHNITLDNRDLTAVLSESYKSQLSKINDSEQTFDEWQDEGYWLVWLLIPIVLLSFRKGVVLCAVLCISIMSPTPSYAFSLSELWNDLWHNDDQRGLQHFEQQEYQQAAEDFASDEWKNAAHYKNGDYQKALDNYSAKSEENMSAQDFYNQGNAYAQLGKYDNAIASYDKALSYLPKMKDALHNKQLLEQMQNQQGENGESQDGQQGEQGKKGEQNQDGQQGDSSQKSQDGQQSQGEEPADIQEQLNRQQEQQQNQQGSTSTSTQQLEDSGSDSDGNQGSDTVTQQQEEDNTSSVSRMSPEDLEAGLEDLKSEEKQALEQWLRRIPDDPAGLLRNKFRYQYQLERQQGKPAVEQDEEVYW